MARTVRWTDYSASAEKTIQFSYCCEQCGRNCGPYDFTLKGQEVEQEGGWKGSADSERSQRMNEAAVADLQRNTASLRHKLDTLNWTDWVEANLERGKVPPAMMETDPLSRLRKAGDACPHCGARQSWSPNIKDGTLSKNKHRCGLFYGAVAAVGGVFAGGLLSLLLKQLFPSAFGGLGILLCTLLFTLGIGGFAFYKGMASFDAKDRQWQSFLQSRPVKNLPVIHGEG